MDGHLAPFSRALGLVLEHQGREVEVFVLDLPTDREPAAAPAVGLEHQRRGCRVDHHFHARLDRLVLARVKLARLVHRAHREPIFGVARARNVNEGRSGFVRLTGFQVNPESSETQS